jgi:hypothetical protein
MIFCRSDCAAPARNPHYLADRYPEVVPFLRTEFAVFLSEPSAVTSYPQGSLPKVPLDRRRAARWKLNVAHAASFTAVEPKYAVAGIRAPSEEYGQCSSRQKVVGLLPSSSRARLSRRLSFNSRIHVALRCCVFISPFTVPSLRTCPPKIHSMSA